ncbi:hypothetical protein PF001_g24608 [Phytophthora fragariae]|uniref:Uncharacterized protein n=1 Tax=Phytophthora fragariae TaxID=53985 RepID=A0A6A4BSB0_9STRA|nr:hypothetical protein PF004_g4722 [Phytophthora fragariae]KAE9279669.1 hypothetical protein PF001_g24608 [Phytophthora fragariae]
MEGSPAPTIAGVDIVGCDAGDAGRSCTVHDVCGKHLKIDDAIVFRGEAVMADNGDVEYAVKAYVIRLGAQLCHVGFLPRRLLRQRTAYENKMATVVEDLRKSDNSQKRRRSERNKGIGHSVSLRIQSTQTF